MEDALKDRDPSNLVERLRHHARLRPDRILYRFLGGAADDEETLSFAELDACASRIARHLHRGPAAYRAALLLYPPGLEFIRAFFGCLYAGVVAVPAYLPGNRRENWERLRRIARDARAASC